MIMKGEKFFHRAFRPCFIYNSCKSACQEQADFPPVLACLKSYCSRANWIKESVFNYPNGLFSNKFVWHDVQIISPDGKCCIF